MGLMVETSYVDVNPHIFPPIMLYMCNSEGIFVAGAYMATRYEVDIVVGCVLSHICTSFGPICLYRMECDMLAMSYFSVIYAKTKNVTL